MSTKRGLSMATKKAQVKVPAKKVPAAAKTKQVKTVLAKAQDNPSNKRVYFKQSDFPLFSLQEAQRVAAALMDDFGGREGSPPDVAISISASPSSSTWRDLAGASISYGLTEGGPNASVIKLLSLGKRLVAPEEEGEDLAARREAILKPRIAMEFFEKYRRAKFPSDLIAGNVLKSLGIPPDRLTTALSILKANGQYAGIIRDTPTGPFINLDSPGIPGPSTGPSEAHVEDEPPVSDMAARVEQARVSSPASESARPMQVDVVNNRVFITHGKQRESPRFLRRLFGLSQPTSAVA